MDCTCFAWILIEIVKSKGERISRRSSNGWRNELLKMFYWAVSRYFYVFYPQTKTKHNTSSFRKAAFWAVSSLRRAEWLTPIKWWVMGSGAGLDDQFRSSPSVMGSADKWFTVPWEEAVLFGEQIQVTLLNGSSCFKIFFVDPAAGHRHRYAGD